MRLASAADLRDAAEHAIAHLRYATQVAPPASQHQTPRTSTTSQSIEDGETYTVADDEAEDAESRFLCYRCGRSHEWFRDRAGEEFLCTCGAKIQVPELIPSDLDDSVRRWYHAVSEALPAPDFDSAVATESTIQNVQRQRRRHRSEVRLSTPQLAASPTSEPIRAAKPYRRGSVAHVLVGLLLAAGAFFALVMGLTMKTQAWYIAAGISVPVAAVYLVVATRRWCGSRSLINAIAEEIESLG